MEVVVLQCCAVVEPLSLEMDRQESCPLGPLRSFLQADRSSWSLVSPGRARSLGFYTVRGPRLPRLGGSAVFVSEGL